MAGSTRLESQSPYVCKAASVDCSFLIFTASGALVLEYSDGNSCSENRDHSATTKINFECGSTFGAPEFVDKFVYCYCLTIEE